MAATPATCIYCKRDMPHERHVTQLEYLRIFGDMESYANDIRCVGESSRYVVVATAAKERVA